MKNDNRILGSTGSVIDPNSSDDWKGYFSMYNTQKKEMTYEEAASTFGTGVNTFASAVPQVVSRPGHDQTANAQKMMFTQSRIVAEMERYNQMWASRMANTEEEETEFLMEVTDVDNIEMADEPLCESAVEGVEVSESGDIVPEAPNAELAEADNSVIETTGELVDMDFGYDLPDNIEFATGDICVPVDVPASDIEMSVDIEIDDNSETDGVGGQIEESVVVESEALETPKTVAEESVKAEEKKPAEAKKTASETTPAKKVGRPKKTETSTSSTAAKKKTPAKKPAAKKPASKAKKTTATTKKSTTAKKSSAVKK